MTLNFLMFIADIDSSNPRLHFWRQLGQLSFFAELNSAMIDSTCFSSLYWNLKQERITVEMCAPVRACVLVCLQCVCVWTYVCREKERERESVCDRELETKSERVWETDFLQCGELELLKNGNYTGMAFSLLLSPVVVGGSIQAKKVEEATTPLKRKNSKVMFDSSYTCVGAFAFKIFSLFFPFHASFLKKNDSLWMNAVRVYFFHLYVFFLILQIWSWKIIQDWNLTCVGFLRESDWRILFWI